MKRLVALISALLAVGLVGSASAAALHPTAVGKGGGQPACADETDPTRTFVVKVKVLDEEYRIGQKAKFVVRVKRVVAGGDLGPVEGAQVGVGVAVGDVYLRDGAVTDTDGRALVEVPIKRHTPAGRADVDAEAWKMTGIDTPCNSKLEYEYGDVTELGLFRVVR